MTISAATCKSLWRFSESQNRDALMRAYCIPLSLVNNGWFEGVSNIIIKKKRILKK